MYYCLPNCYLDEVSSSMLLYSTLEAHCGPVWALQHKNELLISGHQDKVVKIFDTKS